MSYIIIEHARQFIPDTPPPGVAFGPVPGVNQTWWFSLSPVTTLPAMTAPGGGIGYANTKAASEPQFPARQWSYAITAINAAGVESLPLIANEVPLALWPTNGYTCDVSWVAAAGARKYIVYRGRGGIWGFIGEVEGIGVAAPVTTYHDKANEPDFTSQPPKGFNPWASGAGAYPSVVAFHQDRRVFAGGYSDPAGLWFSKVGQYNCFDSEEPPLADDAIQTTVAARRYQEIRALVPHQQFLVFTNEAEVAAHASQDGPIQPDDCVVSPQSFYGCSWIDPLSVETGVVFVQDRAQAVRFLGFNQATGGYAGPDLSLAAAHLLEGSYIVDWAYCRAPYSTVWAVRDDGVLLGLSLNMEQQVAAWHWHTLGGGGLVESLCSVPYNGEDVLFLIVNRAGVRTIERMASRFVSPSPSNWGVFLDCASVYDMDPAVNRVTNVAAPIGASVSAVVDGFVYTGLTVDGLHQVFLPDGRLGSHWVVGYPYASELELLDVAIPNAEIRTRPKLVTEVRFEVLMSRGLWAGEDLDHMTEWQQRQLLGAIPLETTEAVVAINSTWNKGGRAVLAQVDPLPLEILAVSREVEVG